MDFYNGIVLLPYTKIFDKTLHKWCRFNLDNCTEEPSMQFTIYFMMVRGNGL